MFLSYGTKSEVNTNFFGLKIFLNKSIKMLCVGGGNEQQMPKGVKQKKINTDWKGHLNNNIKGICCVPSFVHF